MRTIVDIPEEVIRKLDVVAEREDRSRASLIREAVGEYLAGRSTQPMEAAFGVWKARQKSGLAYQQRLRSEWESR